MSDAKPYTLPEAERLAAYHGAPATRCPLDDDRFLATVRALDNANQREAAIWAALSRAGVSHGQSVEGLEEGLSVVRTKRGLMADRARAEKAEVEAAAALRETLKAAVKRVADRLAAREVEDTDAPVSPPGPETSGLPG